MAYVIGGIGLFLLGMMMLTTGLKDVAGDALKKWLNRFTGGTTSAVLSGTFMTILMQSSTATTLLTVGFVSAGLLTFTQSIGVIIGANIGSTSTGWIISLIGFKVSLSAMALPIIGIGVFSQFVGSKRFKTYGSILTGFGLLFYGIDVLQQGMENAQDFISFESVTAATLVGKISLVLIGMLMTIIMQASSASMAATLTALYANVIDFEQAFYLVIGQNIGTTATALVVAIGASVAAKRTAMTHFLFNVITALAIIIGAPLILQLTKWLTIQATGQFDETIGLAIFHTMFSLLGALLFIPFVQPFARLLTKVLPEKPNALTAHLDQSIVSIPPVALDVVFKTLVTITRELTDLLLEMLMKSKSTESYEERLAVIEEALSETGDYMTNIDSKSSKDRKQHIELLHTIDHLSRLVKVMQEPGMLSAPYVKEKMNEQWTDVFVDMKRYIQQDKEMKFAAEILRVASQEMAAERKRRREQYFEHTILKDKEVETAMTEVEYILWMDRLIYHYWRATARMDRYVQQNDVKDIVQQLHHPFEQKN